MAVDQAGGGVTVQHSTGRWRLTQSVEQLLHIALYTRAVLGLPVTAGAPPPLRGAPDPGPALGDREAVPAVAAWGQWWNDQVALVALMRGADRPTPAPPARAATPGGMGSPPHARGDRDRWAGWTHWRERVTYGPAGPPDYDGLDELLRPAAVSTWKAADTWTTRHVQGRPPDQTELGWAVAAEAAAAVAFDRDVPVGELHGLLLPLAVTGIWWAQWAPGIVLCSFDAITDPTAARAVAYNTLAGPHRT